MSVEKLHTRNFCNMFGISWPLNERKYQCIIVPINVYFGHIVFKSPEELFELNKDKLKQFKNGKFFLFLKINLNKSKLLFFDKGTLKEFKIGSSDLTRKI